MKRLMLVVLLSFAGSAFATDYFPRVEIANTTTAPVVAEEASVSSVGTPTTVSISTSAWTLVPAASSLASRTGLIVSVPATLNANVVGHLGGCTSTAIATTVRPIEIVKGNSFTLFPLSNDVCLWLLSIHTAAESVHVQEIAQ